jgi:hypothetical protein
MTRFGWDKIEFTKRMKEFACHPVLALVGFIVSALLLGFVSAVSHLGQSQSVLSQPKVTSPIISIPEDLIGILLWVYAAGKVQSENEKVAVFVLSVFGGIFLLNLIRDTVTAIAMGFPR